MTSGAITVANSRSPRSVASARQFRTVQSFAEGFIGVVTANCARPFQRREKISRFQYRLILLKKDRAL